MKCGVQSAECGMQAATSPQPSPPAERVKRINSRQKGARGERAFAALLREHGFDARRGQQFAGGNESPDVVSRDLAWLHIETKHVEQLNLSEACAQAARDGSGKPWVVAHRRNGTPWRITMSVETFFEFLRGVLPPERTDALRQEQNNNKA